MADIIHAVSTDHVLRIQNEQRKEGILTDVTLKVDGQEFKAHKSVLAASSEYFKVMFTSNFREQNASVIKLDDTPVDGDTLEVILDLIYSGKLCLSTENVLGLVTSMDFLQMHEHLPKCEHFLETHVSEKTCAEYYEIATKYKLKEAAAAARSEIVDDFLSFYTTKEFKNLSLESVINILSAPDLHVNGEEMVVLRAACLWLGANEGTSEQVESLLFNNSKVVDYRIISEENLRYIMLFNLLDQSSEILKCITDIASRFHSSPIRQPILIEKGRRPRGVQCLVSVYVGDCISKLVFREVERNSTVPFRDIMFPVTLPLETDECSCITFGSSAIFIFGQFGTRGDNGQYMFLRCIVPTRKWLILRPPPSPNKLIRFSAMTCDATCLYLFRRFRTAALGCAQYTIANDTWTELPEIPKVLGGYTIATCYVATNNMVYVAGRNPDARGVCGMCAYDIKGNKWLKKASTCYCDDSTKLNLIAACDRLYLFEKRHGRENNVEEYNVDNDQWTILTVNGLKHLHDDVWGFAFGGDILLSGIFEYRDDSCSERSKPRSDKWMMKFSLRTKTLEKFSEVDLKVRNRKESPIFGVVTVML